MLGKVVQVSHLLYPLLILCITRAEDDEAVTNDLYELMRRFVLTSKKRHAVLEQLTSLLSTRMHREEGNNYKLVEKTIKGKY